MFPTKLCFTSKGLGSLLHLQYLSHHVPKRTIFEFFKFWKDQKPKTNISDLPYAIVTPATVSPRRVLPEHIQKPEYADTGIPGMPSLFPILADHLDVERMRAAGQMARKVLDLAAKEVKVSINYLDSWIFVHYFHTSLFPNVINW